MVIRFESKAGSFIMLAEHALPLIQMTGHSGTVPGAIAAAEVARALDTLRAALVATPASAPSAEVADGRDGEPPAPPVTLRQRAFALTDLLERAARKGCDVQWAEEVGGVLRP
jgi:hypothetical protein